MMNIHKRYIFGLQVFRLTLTTFLWIGLAFGGTFIPAASASRLQNVAGEHHPIRDLKGVDGETDLNGSYRDAIALEDWWRVKSLAGAPHFAQLASVDGHWAAAYGLPGTSQRVLAFTQDGSGNIYAGGDFLVAENQVVNRIARWDGFAWSALGSGANARVNTLMIDSSDHLYIGGEFSEIGGITALRVAIWDGSSFSPLSTGMNNDVIALVLDDNGNLYAGGSFTTAGGVVVNRVAMWDGNAWHALGSGLNGAVNALALDSSGNLYAGGEFTTAGGNSANYIAKWNGSTWSPLSSGMSGFVRALEVDEWDNLYAGGSFLNAGGVTVNRVAKWDGNVWSALAEGMNSTVFDLEFDESGQLYVVGQFTTAGNYNANYIAKWNGNIWLPLDSGLSGVARSVISGSDGKVYAGGDFLNAGAANAIRVAVWDGTGWFKMGAGKGMDDSVLALAVVANGEYYVGGDFLVAGDQNVNRIAHWDGSDWSLLWGGMNNNVQALAYDENGNLYVGGAFTSAGGISAYRIARWNGAAWFALSTGLNGQAKALALDGNGNLFVGGTFTIAGGVTANYVAKWNGVSWSSLGSGMNSYVSALAVDDNGNLYAGGNFTAAGGESANRIAMWDGNAWSPLSIGMNDEIMSVALDGSGNLYAGGIFTTAGGLTVNRVAKWDGSDWSSLGNGMNNAVNALLATQDGTLYAGGSFSLADGASANRIALWNGSMWTPLGSGLNTTVRALAADQAGSLYVGGDFIYAGGKPSYHIARWSNDPPIALDDDYSMLEDTWLSVAAPGVLTNDSDINLDPIVPTLEVAPALGALNFLADGSFVYTATVNYNGLITFTYSITDGFGGADIAQVAISVTATNDPPVAENDVAYIDEDESVSLAVLSNDMDIDGDVLIVESLGLPDHGTAVISGTTQVFYTPMLNYVGMDVFTYTMSDGLIADSATIAITITPVNDAPLAADDSFETDEDVPLSIPIPGVLGNDTDAENQPLVAVLDSSPQFGDLFFSPQGDFIFTPTLNYNGADSFTYHATDGISDSNTAMVNLIIHSVNDQPVGVDDYYSIDEDTPLDVEAPGLLENDYDVDGDDLTATWLSGPSHGVLALNLDGSFQYLPQENYYGLDVFSYIVTDENSGIHFAQAYITIASENDLPYVDAGEDQTVGEGQLANFSGTFLDPGLLASQLTDESIKWDFGDGTQITGTLEPTHIYVENGTYTVTLTITDVEGGVGQDFLIVAVENEAPTFADYGDQVTYLGEVLAITLNFTDPGVMDEYIVVMQWGDGISQSLNLAAGVREFTAAYTYQDPGLYNAVISITDDDGGADEVSFEVSVILSERRIFLPVVSRH